MSTQDEETAFENEVRRVARWIYTRTESQGAMQLKNRERDAVFITDDVNVAIEATVSTATGKARYDAKKLVETMGWLREQYPDRPCTALFITRKEPTNHQRQAISDEAGNSVACMSLDTFRSRVIDVGEYLACRDEAPFGSARNPLTDSTKDVGAYNPLDLLRLDEQSTLSLEDVEEKLVAGHNFILTGDYGAGKSMTLREIYNRLTLRYRTGQEYRRFPIYLNMREHHGQTDPVEALERHARNVAFSRPDKLVRAWRSGMCTLLVDGFDEIAPATLAGVGRDPDSVRELNYRSVELIRTLLHQSPVESGIIVAGRSNYFQSTAEADTALGMITPTHLSLSDFTASQMRQYLVRQGWATDVPDWLPRRPLLLGWLASRDFLSDTFDVGHLPASTGWDWLLNLIFERESKIEGGIDGSTLRRVLEAVATRARCTSSGMGPIYLEDLRDAFRAVLKYAPDQRQEVLLKRLPGLGNQTAATDSKQFVDGALADAARAGDVARHIMNPDGERIECQDWTTLLEPLGAEICLSTVAKALGDAGPGAIRYALRRAARAESNSAFVADLYEVALLTGSVSFDHSIVLRHLVLPDFHLSEEGMDLHRVTIEDCIVENLHVDDGLDETLLPFFTRCSVTNVLGVNRQEDLPSNFSDCTFEHFSATATTTNALVQSDLPRGARLGLVCLRKLYWQRGSSRREDSMTKGIPPEERRYVAAVLKVLASHGLATSVRHGNTVLWQPVRSQDRAVRRWLAVPSTARGAVFEALSSV